MPELNKAIVAYAPNTTMVHNVTCIRASEMRFCGLTHTPKIFPLVPNPSAMPSSAIEPIRPPIGNASDKAIWQNAELCSGESSGVGVLTQLAVAAPALSVWGGVAAASNASL